MKKAVVVAVGKIKETFLKEGIAEYSKRLSRFCDFSVKETEESKREDIAEEGRAVCKELGGGYNIIFDINGDFVTSGQFAEIIANAYLNHDRINFVVGGSKGLDGTVKSLASKRISFGRVTYPHRLFRLLLCEQIYRAFTINAGLPYHK